MLICEECGKIATEEEWRETCSQTTLFGSDKLICPDCGSEKIVPAQQCDHCHNWYTEDMLVIAPDVEEGQVLNVCTDCYEEHYFIPPKGDEDEDGSSV